MDARSRILALLLAILAPIAHGAPSVSLREVATGFSSPVEVAHAADGSGRLFVVEQAGRIRILRGATIGTPAFLDISTGGIISSGGERGLLGLAFHPNYAANRAFYIYYTKANGNLVLARVLRSLADPDVADPASRVELLEIPHPSQANHNGGKIAFGADGLLYIGVGDGGGSGDPFRAAQNLNDGRGKLLRIAVNGGTSYSIPSTNPFAASTCSPLVEFCREVYHYGLRNPWKFSFDRALRDLFIADVGQGAVEEVDYVPAGTAPGLNFGWGIFEGNTCFSDTYFGPAGACAGLANHTRPILTYGHDSAGGFSITGGYRYRGKKSLALRGYYIYADYVSKRIWAARQASNGAWSTEVLLPPPAAVNGISSFAEDEAGELYVVDHGNGKLWAIDAPGTRVSMPQDLNGDARSDLLYRNQDTGAVYRLLMNGTGIASQGPAYVEPDTAWRIVGDADFDGDGVNDLLWRHAGTGNVYFMRMGAAGLPIGGSLFYSEPNPAWRIVHTPDIDGDGRADILWWNATTGAVWVMFMNGATVLAQGPLYQEPDTDWRIAAVADVVGNGQHNCLLWRHRLTGRIYQQRVGGGFSVDGAFIYQEPDTAWKLIGAADFNGDGKSDMLWRHDVDGRVFVMLRDGAQGQVYQEPNTAWKIVATGDYDGDGKADLLWRNDATGQVYMMLMDGLARRAEAMVYQDPNAAWRLLGTLEYGRASGALPD